MGGSHISQNTHQFRTNSEEFLRILENFVILEGISQPEIQGIPRNSNGFQGVRGLAIRDPREVLKLSGIPESFKTHFFTFREVLKLSGSQGVRAAARRNFGDSAGILANFF